jgi:hypothetical protein
VKNRIIRSLDNIIVAALAAVLLVAGIIDIAGKPEQKKYADQYMSFVFPGDYSAVPTSYDGLTVVEIKSDQKKFADVARIELTNNSNESLEQILKSSYSDFSTKQIKKIYKVQEGYQFSQTTANESVIYTYLKEQNSIFMIKFYESYYDSNNALVKISNSLLMKDFYRLINSFDIK